VTPAMQRILTVPRRLLMDGCELSCYEANDAKCRSLVHRISTLGRYVPRREAETDASLVQVIAYGSILQGDRVLLLRRSDAGARDLRNRYAVAVGGHVDEADASTAGDPIRTALLREAIEELRIYEVERAEQKAFVYDASTGRSSQHLCAYYEVQVSAGVASARLRVSGTEFQGVAGTEAGFVPVDQLARYYEDMDPWSRILARHHFCVTET